LHCNWLVTIFSYRTQQLLILGDGANDVAMIQEANVGVGIMGREGTQVMYQNALMLAKFYQPQKNILP